MKTFRRIIFAIFLAGILLFWTIFTIGNPGQLSLKFLTWESMGLPLSIWLLIAFILGGFCGILLCASGFIRGKAVQRQLRDEIDRNHAEEVVEHNRSTASQESNKSAIQSTARRPMSSDDSYTSEPNRSTA